ncbi:MAG: gfo/Idh/MocA family oxidoreductase [Frankiales bacterium]|nr:gfo/Idh/MocA family oxidoreductase [Frankiales bacterium]
MFHLGTTDCARPVRVAVVGYGYWGPNLVRNVLHHADMRLVEVCELDESRAQACRQRHTGVRTTTRLESVLSNPDTDAVIVATPPRTHHAIVAAALRAGKHVLVEKPLATTSEQARELVQLALDAGLLLMPGHTFVYSPAVNLVADLIETGEIGDVHFVTSSRMNLGKYQHGGVLCDLAPHDLSILLRWIDSPIDQVSATGCSVFRADTPETAFMTLQFAGGPTANVQLSWLAPRKVRQIVVVGSRRMVVYDDTASDEPVRVYDRGMDVAEPVTFGEHQLTYRSGDVVIPWVEPTEPLALELADFCHCINTGDEPRSNAALGLAIVEALEAAERSLGADGAPVAVHGQWLGGPVAT